MIAEIFRPLLRPLPRHAYLPLFYAFFAVGSVLEFPELRACLGVHNGLQRFFDGLPGPPEPSPGAAGPRWPSRRRFDLRSQCSPLPVSFLTTVTVSPPPCRPASRRQRAAALRP